MTAGGELIKILEVLAVVDGYFVFKGPGGDEYVIGRRSDFDGKDSTAKQQQLDLLDNKEVSSADDEEWSSVGDIMAEMPEPPADDEAGDEEFDDLDIPRLAKRVSFEPIKGDLSPDLQE